VRTHFAEVTVPTISVVDGLDVEHVRPCLLPRPADYPSYPLFLQTAEKRLRHGIVEAVAPTVHTGDESVVHGKQHCVVASVLGHLIGVNNNRLLGATAPDGDQQDIRIFFMIRSSCCARCDWAYSSARKIRSDASS